MPFKLMLSISLLCLLSSCASSYKSTPYQKRGKYNEDRDTVTTYGLKITKYKKFNGLQIYNSSFTGNNRTSKYDTFSGALIGAFEYCHARKKFINIFNSSNKTKIQKRVGSYSTGGYKIGNKYTPTTTHVYDYNVTFPEHRALFSCSSKYVILPGSIKAESISPILVKDFIKDYRGAVLVLESSMKRIKKGDLITKINGKRIVKPIDFDIQLNYSKKSVNVELYRNKKRRKFKLQAKDIRKEVQDVNNIILQEICSDSDYGKVAPICSTYTSPTTEERGDESVRI